MDPSPIPIQPPHAPTPAPHDVTIKTEERARPIPALQTQQPQRVQRYKDKFQALRERYESVTATHTEYTRAVQRATEKEQRLQAEINMLLDAALANASQIQTSQQPSSASASTPVAGVPGGAPGAAHSMTTTPTPVHAQLSSPPALEAQVPPLPPAHLHSHSHSPHVPHAHTNGHASLTAPHGHGHAHAYGAANHAPSGRAPGSSAGHSIPNERTADTTPF